MNATEIGNTLAGMAVEELREVWAAAMKRMGCSTAGYLKTGHRSEDVLGYLAAGNRAGAVCCLLLELHHNLTGSKKTGRRVLSRATTSAGSDRVIDETLPDYTVADLAVAEILADAVGVPS